MGFMPLYRERKNRPDFYPALLLYRVPSQNRGQITEYSNIRVNYDLTPNCSYKTGPVGIEQKPFIANLPVMNSL
jgi:hypothetical protein